MKLIVDVCKKDYAETIYRKQHSSWEMDWADRLITNGTFLDSFLEDIKAEIKENDHWDKAPDDVDLGSYSEGLNKALEIIDKHRKEEVR